MPVYFGRPIYLLLLGVLPLVVYVYSRSLRSRAIKEQIACGLRLFLLILLIAALAQVRLVLPSDENSVIYVVDLSASMEVEQRDRARDFISESLAYQQKEDSVGIVVFGANAVVEALPQNNVLFTDFHSTVQSNYTNIQAGLDLALDHLSQIGNRRVVILSDGEQNMGSALQTALVFRENGIPIDVYPLSRENGPEVLVDQVFMAPRVRRNQEFPLRVSISSTQKAEGTLRLYHNDRLVEEEEVILEPGVNGFVYEQSISSGGFHRYRVEVDARPDTILANNWGAGFVVVEGHAPILLISNPSPEQDSFIAGLQEHDMDVETRLPSAFPATLQELQSFAAVIINDVPSSTFSRGQLQILQSYVRDFGGGLVALAGENSFGMGEYTDTPLETMLPVHSRIEQRVLFPTLTMLIVLDKSGSMGEVVLGSGGLNKMDLAKEATVAVLDMLVSEERIGLLAFDNHTEWIIPIQRAQNKTQLIEELAPLLPGGGTLIYPALQEAYRAMIDEKTALRHIVLLSDGISVDADYRGITERLRAANITLSAIALGDDVDLDLMTDLANWGGGELYYTTDINEITQIFVAETSRMIRHAISEESFQPIPLAQTPLVAEISWAAVPKIHGFIATTARELADVHLITPDNSPLLASWRYGLGRTVSFLSDMGGNWLQDWVGTGEYEKLVGQMVRHVLRDATVENVFPQVVIDELQGRIIVDALDYNGDFLNFLTIDAGVSAPQGDFYSIMLNQSGPGEYQGVFDVTGSGTYLVTINWESQQTANSVQTGVVVPYSPEYRLPTGQRDLMGRLAQATDGRELSDPAEVFAVRDTFYHDYRDIWSWFVLAALLLFVLDIGVRLVTWQALLWPWVASKEKRQQRQLHNLERLRSRKEQEEQLAKRRDLNQ